MTMKTGRFRPALRDWPTVADEWDKNSAALQATAQSQWMDRYFSYSFDVCIHLADDRSSRWKHFPMETELEVSSKAQQSFKVIFSKNLETKNVSIYSWRSQCQTSNRISFILKKNCCLKFPELDQQFT